MYAIIDSGGRQVRVEPGAVVSLYRRPEPAGESVIFDNVLFVASDDGAFVSGSPHVAGATVTGVVDGEAPGQESSSVREETPEGHAQDDRSPDTTHTRSNHGYRDRVGPKRLQSHGT